MENTERIDRSSEEANQGEDTSAIVASVLDDICQKVVSAAKQTDPIEPNIDYDELTNNSSPDIDTDIDVERGNVTPSEVSLRKEDTLVLSNEDSDKDVDNGDEREPLSYELEQGNRILKEIMSEANKSVNWAFMEAVDAEKMGLYDYYDRIKKPMWLKKVKKKFEDREYTSVTEFAADFRLMLENCYRYNGPDHYVSKRGQRLETMFEQKLSLLSRELREKTSISATTGQNVEERVISGTRRRKVLVPHDSTALLNQLRLEEKEREREQRRQQMLEKQKEREEFEQTLQGWEDELLEQPIKDYMRTMWEIPAIGHFLFLCTVPLNLGEVMHWELERCFAMPRESLTMQTVMTSLLSTPYQRTKLDKKPLMPYKVWEEKLRVRVRQWYKVYKECNREIVKTLNKIGLEEKFFKVVGHKNPLEKKKYHELTFYQRVWIMKGLCDWCMETQESIREAIECQPVLEQRSYPLGSDADGNMYLHFPQFCGQDVRVYRQAPIKMPKLDKSKAHKQKFSITVVPPAPSPKKRKGPRKKKKKKEEIVAPSSPTPRSRHSRLRQNPKQIAPASALGLSDTETTTQSSDEDSGISENETDDGQPAAKKRSPRYRKPLAFEQSDNDSREATPISFFRSRFAALERIKDTPSRESTPGPSPIPTRLTRPQQLKDDSSRASTPISEVSSPSKCRGRKGRGRGRKGKRGGKSACRKVNLEEDEGNSNLPDVNGSIASNDLSMEINENSLIDTEDASVKGSEVKSSELDKGSNHSEECSMAAEDNSNSSCSTDKLLSQAISQDKAEVMDDSSCGINGSQTPVSEASANNVEVEKLSCNGDVLESRFQTPSDSELDKKNSSQGVKSEDGVNSNGTRVSSPSPTNCDTKGNAMPFNTYKKESPTLDSRSIHADDSKVSNTVTSKSVENDCEQSTSGTNTTAQLVMKEESNDSTSTSPYSVSDMSVDEMETSEDNKAAIDAKIKDIKRKGIIKMVEESSASDSIVKSEMKEDESQKAETVKAECKEERDKNSEINGDLKPKTETENNKDEPAVNGELKSEEIKEEVKEEENTEESEDEEPEITEPERGEFELVVDNLDDLRDLIKRFAEPEPIIEKKGKKEKIIQPPPRKRCEKELHDRLVYLLSELEPWEQKLQQANKRAKIRLRKEHESYVEEPEPKEDVWSSEEEAEESSDDNSDDDSSDDNATDKNEEFRPKRYLRKRVMTEIEKEIFNAELPEELGISSRGRIRKRRIIPNNIEDQGLKKRKKEPDHSPSPTPNILQRSKSPAVSAAVTTSGQPQYKAVLNQLHMPASLNAAKGGFQLLSINNQMVLVSTGPQRDKNGNPVATTQPTVLAHISGSSQPVALPLSVVTALQAQAKLQQQQQQQQPQSTAATTGQQALKTLIASKTASNTVTSIASQQDKTTSTSIAPVSATDPKVNSVSASPVSSTTHSQAPLAVSSQVQQSPSKPVDPKLLQQLLLQQGKIALSPTVVAMPQVTGATVPVAINNPVRPQFYHYNNIAKLPPNVVQQLMKTNTPQQVIRVRPPATTVAVSVNNIQSVTTSIGGSAVNSESASAQSTSGSTALTNLIQAGLMPQAPKVTSFVATSQTSTNAQVTPTASSGGKPTTTPSAVKEKDSISVSQNDNGTNNTRTPTTHVVTVTVSPSGVITSSPAKPSHQAKQISPEIIAKLEAQGVSASKQPNIAAMIQANPGLFKSLGSPPKQKYASNVTVKSLLEKRALENLRHKQGDEPEGKVEGPASGISLTPSETEVQGNKTMVPETNQVSTLSKVSPLPPKPVAKLSPAATGGIRLQNPSPGAGSNVPLTQVIQGGAIRKIQLTPQKPQPQTQIRAQVVQQQVANSQVQTVTVNPSTNVLTIQQNLTPQQLQLLQQQLVAKFGAQNVPQNIQVVQQIPAQQAEATQQVGNQTVTQPQTQTMKQVKVPTGTVTIQPKILVTGTPSVRNVAPKEGAQASESVIDNALKTVMTTVQTSLPTAQIKVNSPFAAATRNVTISTSAMKSPIPAVPAVEAMSTSPTKTVPVNTINNSLVSSTVTSTITTAASASPPSTIINTAGANAIKIIPDVNEVTTKSAASGINNLTAQPQQQQLATPSAAIMQGLGVQKNIVVQMKPQGVQGVVITQGMLQQPGNTITPSNPTVPLTVKQPSQTVHNLLLQQKKAADNLKLVSDTTTKITQVTLSAASTMISQAEGNSNAITNIVGTPKSPLPKGGGKISLSPKTKISSLPYVKPQTIQQIIESKAKASGGSKQIKPPLAPASKIKPTVVMPGTVPGAPVRIVQASTTSASPPQVTPTSVSPAAGVSSPLSSSAGSTMTNVMANIGGKMVQLRVAVAPGQNINQILQSPQLQQQLQQLQQTALSTGGSRPASGQPVSSVQQPQQTTPGAPQQQTASSVATSVVNTNVVKSGSKTIRALTMNQNQQPTAIPPSTKPILNAKIPVAPQILSAKTAAPRAMLTVNQNVLANSNTPIVQTQPNVLLSPETNVSPQTPTGTVQQICGTTANIGQGKVVLVNVGGQIMAAQTVGGKTILMPQGVNLVGQSTTGLAQNVQAQLVANVQPKIIATPQAVGAIGLQPTQAQQTPINTNNAVVNVEESQNEQIKTNFTQPNIVNNAAPSCASLPAQSPTAPMTSAIPVGSLMMVGSGLMPVPTTQPTSIPTQVRVEAGTVVQVSQSLPSQTFRHSMPQQVQISRQAVAMAAPQVAAALQASPGGAVAGGLEQLALAAAQVQEAMQHQQTGTVLKSVPGSNQSQATNNAQISNEYAALPNGTSLP